MNTSEQMLLEKLMAEMVPVDMRAIAERTVDVEVPVPSQRDRLNNLIDLVVAAIR